MEFNPSRLVLARKRRGLSKALLSEKSKVSNRSLGYYESGQITPSDETIQSLSETLQFPTSFFFESGVDEIECDSASFRSLSSMTASLRDTALASGTLAVSLENWISGQFDLPKLNLPKLNNLDPETSAEILRVEWGIGQRPIRNIMHLAEANGIRVFSLPIDSASVDAFSVWHNKTPFIFLNPMKSGERGRMDVGHETGHLCMHRKGIPRSRQAELEADRFASAFLMPAKDVLANVPRNLTLNTIQKLKKRYKVSAIALVVRLRHLDVLTEWQYRSFCIELSQTGQRKKEKNGIPREDSQVLGKVFGVLRSEGISRNSIARKLCITPTELNSLIAGLIMSAVPERSDNNEFLDKSSEFPDKPKLTLVPAFDKQD